MLKFGSADMGCPLDQAGSVSEKRAEMSDCPHACRPHYNEFYLLLIISVCLTSLQGWG